MIICILQKRIYADEFADNYDEVFCYGISFYKKRCKVVVEKLKEGDLPDSIKLP